jgi:DNA-binding transcriptional ArsR family regulator
MLPDDVSRLGAGTERFEVQKVSDPQTMRALGHPVRLALLEVLSLYGSLTATEAGKRIGESATTCSFHLRQLASYGLVEEAGGGKGRARPWRMSSDGIHLSHTAKEPEASIAALALARLARERQLARLDTWLQTQSAYSPAWRHAARGSEHLIFATAEEVSRLADEFSRLLEERFGERIRTPAARPEGALPVEVLTFAYPIERPLTGAEQ